MNSSNTLERDLSKIRQYAGMSKLAIALSATLFLCGQASANPKTIVAPQFDPIWAYCEQSKEPRKSALSLSEVLSRSGLPYEEQRVIKLLYERLDIKELEDICLIYMSREDAGK